MFHAVKFHSFDKAMIKVINRTSSITRFDKFGLKTFLVESSLSLPYVMLDVPQRNLFNGC